MEYNKVIYDGAVLIDLTNDTVTVDELTIGKTAHNSKGEVITGTSRKVVSMLNWNQCPDAVQNFVNEVEYDSTDYTTSEIENYINSSGSTDNTKPIPIEVDGQTFLNVAPDETRFFITQNKIGRLRPIPSERTVRWINSTTFNFRDIGGWACDPFGSGHVSYGKIFRSGNLQSDDRYVVCEELGIKTEIDLTNDGVPAYTDIKHYTTHSTSPMYSLSDKTAWRIYLKAIFEAASYNSPVIIHCSMGADRTGTICCILEGLLGVSQSDIDKDYELTSFKWLRARNGNYQGGTQDWAHLIGEIAALNGTTFRDKVVTFVMSLGFTIDEINAFRKYMTDSTADDLTPPTVAVATITNTLSGVTSNNNESTVSYYQPYEATLTPSSGYKFSNISITMGGVDIKNSCYVEESFPVNKGRISIPSVTGDIVISATAEPPYQNQIPISQDTAGAVYNTTGYKEGYRLNSTGAERAYAGLFVTGFIPFTYGQTIMIDRFKGTESSNGGLFFFDSNHTLLSGYKYNGMSADGIVTADTPLTFTPPSSVHDGGTGTMKDITNSAYIRICSAIDPTEAVCYVYD